MKINLDNVIENESEREYYTKLYHEIKKFIDQNNEITFQQIVKTLGGSDRRVLRLLNEMKKGNEFILSNKKILSKVANGKSIFNKILCDSCDGKIFPMKGKLLEVKKIMDEIILKKPTPTFIYDQRPVNSETTVRRVAYLLWRNDLIDKEILILGDDDLTSLAIGLMGGAKKIIVLDIDERLINFINFIAKEKRLSIEGIVCDFTKGIPKNLENSFDVFLTDPSPIPECFSIFISLGIKLLKRRDGMVGYVSFFPSHQEISIDFQKIMTDKNLIITDIIPRFTEYDFLESTYGEIDKNLLKNFDSGESKISFFENITRFITTKETFKNQNQNIVMKIPLSKAMKRIIEDPSKDPAFMNGEKEFVLEKIKEFKENGV